jgi:ketosteroid isomerase-like protein
MSEENVETFKRAVEAYNRRDVDGFLEVFDPAVEAHPLTLATFGQEAAVYRGHEGLRQFIRDVDETLIDTRVEPSEIRDLGDRLVATGRVRGRGRVSGADTESPIGWIVEFKDGRVVGLRDYLDPKEAVEAAGLEE